MLSSVSSAEEMEDRIYEGEMSRSLYERGVEHMTAIENSETDHLLVRHTWEEHGGK